MLSAGDQVKYYCGQAAFAGAKAVATGSSSSRLALIAAAIAALAGAQVALGG